MGDRTSIGSELARIAALQHGVVSRAQLRAIGFSDGQIAVDITRSRLHRVFRGVYAVGHPELTERRRSMAAVLACGRGAAISHMTAAAHLGLTGRNAVRVDVVARGRSGRGIDGIRRHFVPEVLKAEVILIDRIPVTSASRTIVDLAGMLGERSLRRMVERAAHLELLEPAEIAEALVRRRRRGAAALRRVLAEWSYSRGGRIPMLRSPLEARFLALTARAGLPRPLSNHPLAADGLRLEVDFLWPPERLVVEVDGHAFHGTRVAFERDRRRDRALQLAGYRVIRVTARQIEEESPAVVEGVGRMLSRLR